MKIYLMILPLLGMLTHPVAGATLQDFGYEHLTVNGKVAKGNRPLLVILASFSGARPFAHDASYYDNFVFNLAAQPGVNNYYLEASDGRFFWSRGGTVSLSLPSSMLVSNFTANFPKDTPSDQLYASNIIHQAMLQSAFNFAGYDDNNDGTVSQEELQVAIVSNDGDYGGSNRQAGCIRPAGSRVTVCAGGVALLNHQTDFATFCHELSHSLGTLDLYGVWSQQCLNLNVSLMSCTITDRDVPDICHLDPWHKLQLGWVEPRIFPVYSGGFATIPAAQVIDATTPVLLYDPAAGPSEFYLLEYRARNRAAGPSNDANTTGNGLALWRIKQGGNKYPVLVPRVERGTLPGQNAWERCAKCKGLHQVANTALPIYGPCPAGGVHNTEGNLEYVIPLNNPAAPGQHGWRWCQKCRGMFYGPGQSGSRCPAGGTHDGSASGDYAFAMDDTSAPGEYDWRWCAKCQGMFFAPHYLLSDCPAGGRHDGFASSHYTLMMEGQNFVVWTEGAPDFSRGGGTLWSGGSVTPYLRRLDGTETRLRVHVHPFAVGAERIVVEWWNEQEYWVDYNYPGVFPFLELGTFELPYNTLGEAAAVAPFGGIVSIKSSVGHESISITKRLRLQAYGGPVTIGR